MARPRPENDRLSKPFCICMPPDMLQRLNTHAEVEGMNVSAFIRHIFLAWERRQPKRVPGDFEDGDTENYPAE